MDKIWTPAQRSAIEERNKTLLVSAAAGSGKTAVLTERIIRTITDTEHPVEITELLIVTFTRAAAGEMRKRIAKALNAALSEHPGSTHLTRQLMLLGSAHISTIDSFYLELVKANFEAAGFSPAFRMADDSELYTLRRELMNAAIDRMYTEEPGFGRLTDVFADVRSETALTEQLIEIRDRLIKHPEGLDLLLSSAKTQESLGDAPFISPEGKLFYGELRRYAKAGQLLCGNVLSLLPDEPNAAKLSPRYEPLYGELYERCAALDEALSREDANAVAVSLSAPFLYAPLKGGVSKRTPELVRAVKLAAAFRERFLEMAEKCGAFTQKEIAEGSREAAQLLRLLHRVLTEYEAAYTAAKKEREVAEFADVSRAAYHLLVAPDGSPTPLAVSISDSYAAIYIDEYQDVDAMQDATFRAISKPRNRFMVGDIKQSIYRFRGADPTVFAGYKKSFSDLSSADEEDAATVFMSDCFRCDENVIRFSNAVSGPLFTQCKDSIGYTTEDDLNFKKEKPSPDYLSPKCRLMLLNAKKERKKADEEDEESSAIEPGEAHMIVSEIKRLLREERKADGTRITAGDIAILSRSASFAKNITDLLSEAGIACNDTSKTLFFENPDVLCMYSLLSAIDNPLRDIYLASVLRSPFFGFTLSDLVAIRNDADRSLSLYEAVEVMAAAASGSLSVRCMTFLKKLNAYREKATVLPVDKLLRYLYRDTAVMAFAAGNKKDRGSYQRNANLLQLYEYARSFESTGFKGLYQFVRYVEDVMSSGAELPSPDGPRDAVSLLTIHHSKGLEYPVCFISGTGKRFNQRDLIPPLLCDNELGCGIRLPNAGVFSRSNTFARMAISLAIKQKNLEEEMRVLYVAMTRARERLYVTAAANFETLDERVALMSAEETDFFARGGSSYLEWILTALEQTDHTPFLDVIRLEKEDLSTTLASPAEERLSEVEPTRATALQQVLEERFDFVYPHAHLTKLPAKLSVSRLSPEVLDVYDQADAATPVDLEAPDVERLLHTFEKAPSFGKQQRRLNAAERGTATHEFLQFCRFDLAAQSGVEAELARLIEARFLPPEAKDAVRLDELERFFQSELFGEITAAKEVHRELRFNIFLPAAHFTANTDFRQKLGEEKILVQGVIDLFFINQQGELVLCDYKTDRLTPTELRSPEAAAKTLFDRHGTQLSYYKEALLQICGKYPDKTLIYSLPLGRALSEPQ